MTKIRIVLSLVVLVIALRPLTAQETKLFQVKTFDPQLKVFKNAEVSINGKDYVNVGSKGSAFVQLSESDFPLRSIRIKDEQFEAASWNQGKGIIEIIIRKKNYTLLRLVVKDSDLKPVRNTKIIFQGAKSVNGTTNDEGVCELPLPLNESVTSENQFAVAGAKIEKLISNAQETLLIVAAMPGGKSPIVASKTNTSEQFFKDFDLQKLDSIQSLTAFYAIFKNYPIKTLSPEAKSKVDGKFNQLLTQMQDSIRRSGVPFAGRISDSSFVRDDIQSLLVQANIESQTLEAQRADFDNKIKLISEKLSSGIENLDNDTRARLLADINRLDKLLAENENRFYKNQGDYREVINSLKEKFFNLEDLENQLSISEAQRLEEQRTFRKQLITILSVSGLFAILIILLIITGTKLKRQKQALELANTEIKNMNENLEGLVSQRTQLLEEAHRELDTFLYRASHDLRSPVCSIVGLCNLANHFAEGEVRGMLSKIIETTGAMDKLLQKLAIISEINQPSNFSTVLMLKSIQNAAYHFRKIILDYKIQFKINCDKDVRIKSYPNLIDAILFNLIENAIFYTILKNQGNAEVKVSVSNDITTDTLRIVVYDNGIGVEKNISDRVFKMFFKGHVSSKGNGLGLYIVEKSVQVLGGKILLESEANVYTRFIIELPMNSYQQANSIASPSMLELSEA